MRHRGVFVVIVCLMGIGMVGGEAFSHEVNWPGKRLAKFMPEADSFKEQQMTLSVSQIAVIEKYPGITIGSEDRSPKFYLAYGKPASPEVKASLLGIVVFIDTVGQYGKIELSVAMAPDGKVSRVDVWNHSDDTRITDPGFLKQLEGRTVKDEFHLGHEIKVPEDGPKVSYEAVSRGVQKALLLIQVVFGQGPGIPPAEETHENKGGTKK